jgi:hypothetical protein
MNIVDRKLTCLTRSESVESTPIASPVTEKATRYSKLPSLPIRQDSQTKILDKHLSGQLQVSRRITQVKMR